MFGRYFFKLGSLIVFALLLSACSGADVSLSEEKWDCKHKQCDISFVLFNPGATEVKASYAVRAQSSVKTINSDLMTGLVVAELKESVMLAAGETKTIQAQLTAMRPPTSFTFKAWVK